MKVAVIGSGYVGLVTGVGLALRGHDVTALDIDAGRVERIQKGEIPFYEPGLSEALKVSLMGENFSATNNIQEIVDSEVVFICVQTPPKSDGTINLDILESACRQTQSFFKENPRNRILVVRSTAIPGTTENFVMPIFKNQITSVQTEIAYNPEFLREGRALKDFLRPDRIVIGTNSTKAKEVLTKLYAPFNSKVIITTPSTAEMAKYTSNVLLATLVSFSNQIAGIAEKTPHTDIEDVLGILHLDRRFNVSDKEGRAGIVSYLKAGCGFGGSCLPKDLSALITYAHTIKEEVPLLEAVEEINKKQPARVVKIAKDALGGFDKQKIAVLGVAFKEGTDDLRDSPGLAIVDKLLSEKVKVVIFDPLVNKAALKSYIERGVEVASSFRSAFEGVSACIVASNAPEFKQLNKPNGLSKKMKIIDGRRFLDPRADGKGHYFAVGLSES